MIVDVHAHLGYDRRMQSIRVFEEDFLLDELLMAQEENGIDVTIVQPGIVIDLPSALCSAPTTRTTWPPSSPSSGLPV